MSEAQSHIDPFFLPSMLVVWVFPSNPDLNVSVPSSDQAKKKENVVLPVNLCCCGLRGRAGPYLAPKRIQSFSGRNKRNGQY